MSDSEDEIREDLIAQALARHKTKGKNPKGKNPNTGEATAKQPTKTAQPTNQFLYYHQPKLEKN